MDSTGSTAAVIQYDNLGIAAAFDQSIFPVGYYEADNNFGKGCFLLEATLEEVEKVAQDIDLNKNHDFLFDTRIKVTESVLIHILHTSTHVSSLRERRAKIKGNRKSLNPVKALQSIKDAREFHVLSKDVFLETKVRLPNTRFARFAESGPG